ncbi:hypothetical protein ED733_003828 [Metarhizium rileyi]|uniref:Diaminohydroxyphosphoribosylamino-pyrimidine deaminase n=1 Tax=Metarhizium rileyi (strain RCEF 4871) TaxID=1649241 RepID=A0A5C6G5S0_METRR|nr:hypothetical protein ED733_003828 [Metarhizium rileyi]
MPFHDLLPYLEEEIEDADQETFLLYSKPMPSQDLGFVDSKAPSLEVTLSNRDVTILQSPTLLTSTRAGGTTGAVLWKVSPPLAEWFAAPTNPLFASAVLTSSSAVLELGCGISPLNAFAMAPRVSQYVLSDQLYVRKILTRNMSANPCCAAANIDFRPLDWEHDQVASTLATPSSSFDLVLAADTVYNYALVQPFVQACVDACTLARHDGRQCVCLVAQQLRHDDVFSSWLLAFMERFRVWRVRPSVLGGLDDGFVVHVGVLRDS